MSHKPQITLGSLPHADGSATYTHHSFNIIAAVNGPIEVQRRDEIPDEAFIEVNVRPASGVGGPRERHLETLITTLLRAVVLTTLHPRTLIQLTLQILSTPENGASSAPVPQYASHLPVLPHLLNTAMLALLNGNIPLRTTFVAVCVGVREGGEVIEWPTVEVMEEECVACHVFVVGRGGEVLMVESEGAFDGEGFERAREVGRGLCVGGDVNGDGDEKMGGGDAAPLHAWLRDAMAVDGKRANAWREHL